MAHSNARTSFCPSNAPTQTAALERHADESRRRTRELEAARDSLAERLQLAERHVVARDADLEAVRAEAATQRSVLEQLRKESSAEKQIHSSQVRRIRAPNCFWRSRSACSLFQRV